MEIRNSAEFLERNRNKGKCLENQFFSFFFFHPSLLFPLRRYSLQRKQYRFLFSSQNSPLFLDFSLITQLYFFAAWQILTRKCEVNWHSIISTFKNRYFKVKIDLPMTKYRITNRTLYGTGYLKKKSFFTHQLAPRSRWFQEFPNSRSERAKCRIAVESGWPDDLKNNLKHSNSSSNRLSRITNPTD